MTKSHAILVLAVLITPPASAQSVQLTWTQSVTVGVTSNNVHRGTAEGGPYSPIHSSSSPIVSYTDTDVTVGGYYCYVVTAIVHGRESKRSNESCVRVTTQVPTVVKAK